MKEMTEQATMLEKALRISYDNSTIANITKTYTSCDAPKWTSAFSKIYGETNCIELQGKNKNLLKINRGNKCMSVSFYHKEGKILLQGNQDMLLEFISDKHEQIIDYMANPTEPTPKITPIVIQDPAETPKCGPTKQLYLKKRVEMNQNTAQNVQLSDSLVQQLITEESINISSTPNVSKISPPQITPNEIQHSTPQTPKQIEIDTLIAKTAKKIEKLEKKIQKIPKSNTKAQQNTTPETAPNKTAKNATPKHKIHAKSTPKNDVPNVFNH
jgi:hypothetical protein